MEHVDGEGRREQVNFTAVTRENTGGLDCEGLRKGVGAGPWGETAEESDASGRGSGKVAGESIFKIKGAFASVGMLLAKLRWITIGYSYDVSSGSWHASSGVWSPANTVPFLFWSQWTSKTYDWERGMTPLPPLIDQLCLATVRCIPWEAVFPPSEIASETKQESNSWSTSYNPEAGIINFVGLVFVPLFSQMTSSSFPSWVPFCFSINLKTL